MTMIFGPRRLFPDILALTAIAGIISAFFFRLFWPESQLIVTPDWGLSDAWHFSFVTKYLLGKSLNAGEFPIWNSTMGGGFPLIGESQIGAFYLPNLILFRLFDAITAYNLALVLAVFMLGSGMYAWLRLLEYSPLPSFVAGITLSLSGMVIAQMTHIMLIQSFSLLPWVAGATHLLAERKTMRFVAIWSILASQQLFAGFPQASFITVLFTSGYYLWLVKNHRNKWVQLLWYKTAAMFSLGLAAIQLFPSWEFLSQSNANGGLNPRTAVFFSYPIKHLITLVVPFLLGNPREATYFPTPIIQDGNIFWENVGGIGPLPIILLFLFLIINILRYKKERVQAHFTLRVETKLNLFFLLILFVSFLLMLGKYSPLYLIFTFFPFNLFRVPSRFIWVFVIAILILATKAWSMLWKSSTHQLLIRTILLTGGILNTLFLVSSWYWYHAVDPARLWQETPPSVAVAKQSKGKILSIGVETIYAQRFLFQGWERGVDAYRFLNYGLSPNNNALWNIPSAQAYAGRFLRRPTMIDELLTQYLTSDEREATISATGKKLLDLLSVDTIFSALPLTQHQPDNSGLTEITSWVQDGQTITAWKNPTSLPQAYLATSPMMATTKEQAFGILISDAFIPGKHATVEQPVNLDPAVNGQPGLVEMLPRVKETERVIRVKQNSTSAVLVITDTYYPGWQATVDGNKTLLFPANIRQIGLIVPPGDHEIRLKFVPTSFIRGAWISVATLALLIALAVLPAGFGRIRTLQKALSPDSRPSRSHDR